MKKHIFVKTLAFRVTPFLYDALNSLSVSANRHQSDLIREAVWSFVKQHRDNPDQLLKVA